MNTKKNQFNITDKLVALQNQLYDISARNPFVDVNIEKLWFNSSEVDNKIQAKKIYNKQLFFLKEYGLETTLEIGLFIKWKLPNKDRFFCSPLLYKPSQIKRHQKIDLTFSVSSDLDSPWFVNPILSALFQIHFEFDFKSNYSSQDQVIDLLLTHFNSGTKNISIQEEFSEVEQWQCIKKTAIGTFNYKKSVLAKDFETIIKSPNHSIKHLLGFSNEVPNNPLFGDLDWFPLDVSQKAVVAQSMTNNLVVQGPPGTGKSHTIAAMLTHFLSLGKKVLFVSEKKSALEVVYQRMNKLKPLVAYFDAEKKPKSSYYKSLKFAVETAQVFHEDVSLEQDERRLFRSRAYPNELRAVNDLIGTNIGELERALLINDSDKKIAHTQSQIPNYEFWKLHLNKLKLIEKVAISEWNDRTIGESPFLDFNKTIFNESQPIKKIDIKIEELLNNLKKIQQIQDRFNLQLEWDDFTKLCLSASILSMVNQKQIDLLFSDTKAYKSFNNWSKKYQLTKHQLESIKSKNTLWNIQPDFEQIKTYELSLKVKGLFSVLKRRRLHQAIFKHYRAQVSYQSGESILEDLKKEYALVQQLEELSIKLKHNLNILNPETEIDLIINIRKKMETVEHSFYEQILHKENHLSLIKDLSSQHLVIANINRVKHYLFSAQLPSKIDNFKAYLKRIKSKLNDLKHFVSEVKMVLDLPLSLLNFIRLNKFTLQVLDKIVTQNALDEELKYHDFLKQLSGRQLLVELNSFNDFKNNFYQKIIDHTYKAQLDNWKHIEEICHSPNAKLSEAEKEIKREYKQAKRLVIHEMNKTRQLMPIKDFFETCNDLLIALQPIWMMNPLAIAERLPLQEGIFDVVIFDESSQIPIEDAIPAIYRAKQIIVVGDSQQMPPSHFFSSSTNTIPLLTEAQKHLPTYSLKWHYRSDHPDLIQFSNEQFYDNELKLFPALNDYKPITFHYFEKAIFSQNINQIEADAIAIRYEVLIRANETDIAIIAMSKEQEKCIRKAIIKLKVNIPESVLIRNLESVQGIEKKHVLISIGYAKNEDGRLNLNFGPINHEFGANRLNVLFSRTISKMEVFTSISSTDLGLTDNRGLTILSQFLAFADEKRFNSNLKFQDPLSKEINAYLESIGAEVSYESEENGMIISSFINYEKKKVLFINPGLYSDTAIDLPTVIAILEKRFKTIKIILNSDWLFDSEKVRKELKDYFL
ncbi:MAG: DEAD/DEAH box helicase [Crocinitomicaceae bacterium]